MSLLITGGLGFLGLQTARQFLRRGRVWSPRFKASIPIEQITLFDRHLPEHDLPEDITSDSRVRIMTGDLTEEGVANEIVDDDSLAVVHLASMVSGDTEQDHLRGWMVNVEGQRSLLEALRVQAPGSRFLFTSSTAALGPVPDDAADGADDLTKLLPQNTASARPSAAHGKRLRPTRIRRRAACMPVVVVRPGAPNAALTGAWSSVVREPPRRGLHYSHLDVRLPVASYQTVVANIAHLLDDVESSDLGADRNLMLPSLSASPRELYDAATALAEAEGIAVGTAKAKAQELATRIVTGMGERSNGSRAEALGCVRDESPESIVRAYAEDYVLKRGGGGVLETVLGGSRLA